MFYSINLTTRSPFHNKTKISQNLLFNAIAYTRRHSLLNEKNTQNILLFNLKKISTKILQIDYQDCVKFRGILIDKAHNLNTF